MERIGGIVRVHLLLVIAPAMVANLVSEVLGHGRRGIKGRLPVHALALRWGYVLGRGRLR